MSISRAECLRCRLWMVAQAAKYRLEFDVETLSESGHGFRIVPNAMGQVHDARVGLYGLAPPLHRPLGEASDHDSRLDGCQYLSVTARQRFEEDPAYRPPALDRYCPAEGIWSLLKRHLADFAAADLAHLIRVIKRKLKKIQYRPHLLRTAPQTDAAAPAIQLSER